MRFGRDPFGYLILGVVFSILMALFMVFVELPILIASWATIYTGSITIMGLMAIAGMVIAFMAQGYFIQWFYRKNTFGNRK